MTTPIGAARRRVTALLAAGLLTAGLTIAATPGAAGAAIDPPGVHVTFLVKGGWVDTLIGGWFDGIVVVRTDAASPGVTNTWTWGLQKTGPDGQTYRRLHHVVAGECLSHASGILTTEACSLADDSQWWAVEEFPCPPESIICIRMLMKPLDQPQMAVTRQDGLLRLEQRNGPTGVGQRVLIMRL